jgi:hypothetical protein
MVYDGMLHTSAVLLFCYIHLTFAQALKIATP